MEKEIEEPKTTLKITLPEEVDFADSEDKATHVELEVEYYEYSNVDVGKAMGVGGYSEYCIRTVYLTDAEIASLGKTNTVTLTGLPEGVLAYVSIAIDFEQSEDITDGTWQWMWEDRVATTIVKLEKGQETEIELVEFS